MNESLSLDARIQEYNDAKVRESHAWVIEERPSVWARADTWRRRIFPTQGEIIRAHAVGMSHLLKAMVSPEESLRVRYTNTREGLWQNRIGCWVGYRLGRLFS